MGRWAAVLFAFCGATLLAQAPARDRKAATPLSGSNVVRGRVVAAATGDPLRHARVTLRSGTGTIPTVLSDEEGRFSFTSLPPGQYSLSAAKAGFAKTTSTLIVADGHATEAGDVALARGGVLSGFAVDESGEPSFGTSLRFVRLEPSGDAFETHDVGFIEADDLGAFRLAGLPAGMYAVAPPQFVTRIGPGGEMLRSFVPPQRVIRVPEAQRLTVRTGEETGGVVVTIPRDPFAGGGPVAAPPPGGATSASPLNSRTSATFRGRVTLADGSPLANAQVGFAGGGRVVATDSRGGYELVLPTVEPDREYRLLARKQGYGIAEYGQRRPNGRGVILSPVPGDVQDHLDFTLARLGVITGRIVDDIGEPVEGAVVRAMQVRYVDGRRRLVDAGLTRRTDDLGRYRLFYLRGGRYAIAASVGQVVVTQAAEEFPGFGTTYYPGTPNPGEIQFVSLAASGELDDVDIRLARERGYRVAGHASDSAGEPVTGGIALMPRQRSGLVTAAQMGARIDRDGTFEFLNVAPGEYVLQVVRGTGRAPSSEGEFAYQFVTVLDGDVTDIDIQAGLGSTIRGRLVIEGGGSLDERQVSISAMPADLDRSPQLGGGIAQSRIDDDHTFQLARISGPRRLQATRLPKGWMLKAVRVNSDDVTDVPLPFGSDEESLDGVELVLTDQTTRIAGALAPVRGQPATDFTVCAFAADRELWYLTTRYAKRVIANGDWSYVLEGLPPSEYFVVAIETPEDPGEWQDPAVLERLSLGAKRVRVGDGERVSVDLRPQPRS